MNVFQASLNFSRKFVSIVVIRRWKTAKRYEGSKKNMGLSDLSVKAVMWLGSQLRQGTLLRLKRENDLFISLGLFVVVLLKNCFISNSTENIFATVIIFFLLKSHLLQQ